MIMVVGVGVLVPGMSWGQDTVSYTHLDVYKRQVWGCGGGDQTISERFKSCTMKWIGGIMLTVILLAGGARADAQIDIVTTIISKAVRAADLVVQKLQTETIVLQEAEQELSLIHI